MIKEYSQKGYVSSPLGNARMLDATSENKWVVNHLIQSTSSLIFKQALLNVENSIYSNRYQLVMPMHDAALYIVDNFDMACKDDIEKQFKMAFKHYLPNITPIVKFKNYFEGE